jgi:ABC-type polysaccharide/polyol phosphate export permease
VDHAIPRPARSPLRRQLDLALQDLASGLRNWRTWYVLGVSELRQRYRRSVLGPFWVTLTMIVQVTVMGVLLSYLFNQPITRFFPFLCISLVTWTFLSTAIAEGANCFTSFGGVILQVKRPLSTYILLILWRNAIIYLHTIGVFAVAAVSFRVLPTPTYLLIPVGLAILVANVSWIALASALISARFRDVPMLIQNALGILVWLTPVYYHPEQLTGPTSRMIIDLNPFTSILEVARAPFLNTVPAPGIWLSAVGVAAFGWLFTFALFVRVRARVPYWL